MSSSRNKEKDTYQLADAPNDNDSFEENRHNFYREHHGYPKATECFQSNSFDRISNSWFNDTLASASPIKVYASTNNNTHERTTSYFVIAEIPIKRAKIRRDSIANIEAANAPQNEGLLQNSGIQSTRDTKMFLERPMELPDSCGKCFLGKRKFCDNFESPPLQKQVQIVHPIVKNNKKDIKNVSSPCSPASDGDVTSSKEAKVTMAVDLNDDVVSRDSHNESETFSRHVQATAEADFTEENMKYSIKDSCDNQDVGVCSNQYISVPTRNESLMRGLLLNIPDTQSTECSQVGGLHNPGYHGESVMKNGYVSVINQDDVDPHITLTSESLHPQDHVRSSDVISNTIINACTHTKADEQIIKIRNNEAKYQMSDVELKSELTSADSESIGTNACDAYSDENDTRYDYDSDTSAEYITLSEASGSEMSEDTTDLCIQTDNDAHTTRVIENGLSTDICSNRTTDFRGATDIHSVNVNTSGTASATNRYNTPDTFKDQNANDIPAFTSDAQIIQPTTRVDANPGPIGAHKMKKSIESSAMQDTIDVHTTDNTSDIAPIVSTFRNNTLDADLSDMVKTQIRENTARQDNPTAAEKTTRNFDSATKFQVVSKLSDATVGDETIRDPKSVTANGKLRGMKYTCTTYDGKASLCGIHKPVRRDNRKMYPRHRRDTYCTQSSRRQVRYVNDEHRSCRHSELRDSTSSRSSGRGVDEKIKSEFKCALTSADLDRKPLTCPFCHITYDGKYFADDLKRHICKYHIPWYVSMELSVKGNYISETRLSRQLLPGFSDIYCRSRSVIKPRILVWSHGRLLEGLLKEIAKQLQLESLSDLMHIVNSRNLHPEWKQGQPVSEDEKLTIQAFRCYENSGIESDETVSPVTSISSLCHWYTLANLIACQPPNIWSVMRTYERYTVSDMLELNTAQSQGDISNVAGKELLDNITRGNVDRVWKLIHKSPRLVNSHLVCKYKTTPLELAFRFRKYAVATLLLMCNADQCFKNQFGFTPLEVAAYAANKDAVIILLNWEPSEELTRKARASARRGTHPGDTTRLICELLRNVKPIELARLRRGLTTEYNVRNSN